MASFKFINRVYLLFFLLLTITVLPSCYSVRQASHQLGLFLEAEDLTEYKKRPDADPAILSKLSYLTEVLSYAEAAGLPSDGSYQSIIFPKGGVVSYLAIVAPKDQLSVKTHWFPFVGTVPYLGFFSKEERDEYLYRMKENGYDTHASVAGAFSLLGYFDDPLFSSMLKRSEENFAALFFHELVHKRIWISSNAQFNERLAEFISIKLTKSFLKGSGRWEALENYSAQIDDKKKFNTWFRDLRSKLEVFYKDHSYEEADFLQKRESIFRGAELRAPNFRAYNYVGNKPWNNARVAITSTYGTDYSDFESAFGCLKETYKKHDTVTHLVSLFLEQLESYVKNTESEDLLGQFCRRQKVPKTESHSFLVR